MCIDELVEGVEYRCDSFMYRIKSGRLEVNRSGDWEYSSTSYNRVMLMEFKELPFQPKYGDKYWTVDVNNHNGSGFSFWDGDRFDANVERFGIYRTEEEAVVRFEEIMKLITEHDKSKGEDK